MGKLDYSQYGRSLVNGAFVDKTERSFTVYNPANKQKVVDVQEAGAKGANSLLDDILRRAERYLQRSMLQSTRHKLLFQHGWVHLHRQTYGRA